MLKNWADLEMAAHVLWGGKYALENNLVSKPKWVSVLNEQ